MKKKRMNWTCPVLCVALALLAGLGGCSTSRSAKLINSGDSHLASGNFEAAAEQYRLAAKLSDGQKVRLRLAATYVKQDAYDKALEELAYIPQQANATADYLAAVCYIGINDVATAQKRLEYSLQQNPNDSLSLALLGRIKYLQKDYIRSIEAYQQALSLAAGEQLRTRLYYNIAMAQLQAGRFEKADQSFSSYLARQNFISAEDNRIAGSIAYAVGDHPRALRHWQNLSTKEKRQIQDVIVDESGVYQELASAN